MKTKTLPPAPLDTSPAGLLTVRKAYAKQLLDRGVSIRKAAELSGLAKGTVEKVKKGAYNIPPEMLDALRAQEVAKLELAFHNVVDTIADPVEFAKVAGKASLSQKAVATGILLDKLRLVRGEPTSVEEHRLRAMSDEELEEAIRGAQERIVKLRNKIIEIEAAEVEPADED